MGEDSKLQPDPAEALANMAESRDEEIVTPPDADEEPADPAEVLDRMAAERIDAGDELDDQDEAGDERVEAEAAAMTGVPGRRAYQARGARGARIAGRQARANVNAYKKMMIPLLLVVGALLILIGLLGVSMLIAPEEADSGTRWHALMTAVALVSFPLGAILLFGAWWFHRDMGR